MTDMCQHIQLEISTAHDLGEDLSSSAHNHLRSCDACQAFQRDIGRLDRLLGRGRVELSPPLSKPTPSSRWRLQPVAVALGLGLLVGAIGAGSTRVAVVEAASLGDRVRLASTQTSEFSADLLIYEFGWSREVTARSFTGTVTYRAPETYRLNVIDQTVYPSPVPPNDLSIAFDNGAVTTRAIADCSAPPCSVVSQSWQNLKPFDQSLLLPLEIITPFDSFASPVGLEVAGPLEVEGESALLIRSTVSASPMIRSITQFGNWRDLHPGDTTLIWLADDRMTPLRVEVRPVDTPARQLWATRRGYLDPPDRPILIIDLDRSTDFATNLALDHGAIDGGFRDGVTAAPIPAVPDGFTEHRKGHWNLPEGGAVQLRAWSNGRAWLMVEQTEAWSGDHLFGLASPFVTPIDTEFGVVYLDPEGERLGVHAATADYLISGTIGAQSLVGIARSLSLDALPVPEDWDEAGITTTTPVGALAPTGVDWRVSTLVSEGAVTMLLSGNGDQRITFTAKEGSQLLPPSGPDQIAVTVRALSGRYDAGTGELEWVEAGQVLTMQSPTVDLETLVGLADTLEVVE